jgi:hypothetical protein
MLSLRKEVRRMVKKSDKAKKTLINNIDNVASFLVDTMQNVDIKLELRIACARELREWVYGKATIIHDDGDYNGSEPFAVEITVV